MQSLESKHNQVSSRTASWRFVPGSRSALEQASSSEGLLEVHTTHERPPACPSPGDVHMVSCSSLRDPYRLVNGPSSSITIDIDFPDSALVIDVGFEKLAEENHWALQGLAALDSGTSEDPWTGTWHRRGKGGADHRMVILRNRNQPTIPTGHLTRNRGTCARRSAC